PAVGSVVTAPVVKSIILTELEALLVTTSLLLGGVPARKGVPVKNATLRASLPTPATSETIKVLRLTDTISLRPALTTYATFAVEAMTTPVGLLKRGLLTVVATNVARLITDRLFEPLFATTATPTSLTATPLGNVPTATVPPVVRLSRLMIETVLEMLLVTTA